MPIANNSRYQGQPVLHVPIDAAGHTNKAVFRPSLTIPRGYFYYQVKLGDRFDILANRFLGQPTLWWILADANPEVTYPDVLIPGSTIRIPSS